MIMFEYLQTKIHYLYMENPKYNASTMTSPAFSLLAVLLAAAALKDELKAIHLIFPSISLFAIFVIAAIFIAILLVLYLIIDMKDGTFLESKFNTQKFQAVLNHLFFSSNNCNLYS